MRKLPTWLPWVLVMAVDGVAVWRGYLAAWWYRQWMHSRVFDPAAAERDYANAQGEAVLALLALGAAAVGVALILRAQRRRGPAADAPDAVRQA